MRNKKLDKAVALLPPKSIEILTESSCPNCGAIVCRLDAFCSGCGMRNIAFDPSEMPRIIGLTQEEVQTDCKAGHVGEFKDTREFPELYRKFPYCSHCGQFLLSN